MGFVNPRSQTRAPDNDGALSDIQMFHFEVLLYYFALLSSRSPFSCPAQILPREDLGGGVSTWHPHLASLEENLFFLLNF